MDAKGRYNAKNYDTLSVRIVKGDLQKVRECAASRGQSVAGFVCQSLTAAGCPVSSKLSDKK